MSHLSVSFNRWSQDVLALRDVSFTAAPGQCILLVGPNGAGKSTLLAALSGRAVPSSGVVAINGRRVSDMTPQERARTVYVVRQNPAEGTAPLVTVFENLLAADPNVGRKLSNSARREKYSELLRGIDLSGRLDRPVRSLSGGERQLLALLIAQMRATSVLLCDEPYASLDETKTRLWLEQLRHSATADRVVVVITHNPALLRGVANRTIELREGQLVSDTLAARDFRSPTTPEDITETACHVRR